MPDAAAPQATAPTQGAPVQTPRLDPPIKYDIDEEKANSKDTKDQAEVANMQKLMEGQLAQADNLLTDFRRVLTKVVA